MLENTLLLTDVYKLGHMEQYPPDTEYVYSYLEARKPNSQTVFFGLQYILKEYLSREITHDHVEEFISYYESILGPCPRATAEKLFNLAELGYWPVEIKAVQEGSIVETGNVLMTITNTLPGYHWCVGFLESLLLKVWNPCTVATCSLKYKQLVERFADETCDNHDHIPFQVHDFGYRGVSSEETAAISGAAHLLCFHGSDTVIANKFLDKYYYGSKTPFKGLSVPASEHSVMCAYGQENELEAFRHMLKTYPKGIVSIVSDTYDLWNVLTCFAEELKDDILNREGKVVFRPDSGNPIEIICGSPFSSNPCEAKGALRLLWEKFGGTINSKGYKVLNPQVGLIYGDGMQYDRFYEILQVMKQLGFASSNLVIGVGGLLLQNHNRDEFGFALKATQIIRGGKRVNIKKDPITDPGKKSKTGLMRLDCLAGTFSTMFPVTPEEECEGELYTVFKDGRLQLPHWFKDIKSRITNSLRVKNQYLEKA